MLLNIVLHGMETAAGVRYRTRQGGRVETAYDCPVLVRYADLCRYRHKSAYAEHRIMPSGWVEVLVSWGLSGLLLGIIRGAQEG